jgi:hypothetical protein
MCHPQKCCPNIFNIRILTTRVFACDDIVLDAKEINIKSLEGELNDIRKNQQSKEKKPGWKCYCPVLLCPSGHGSAGFPSFDVLR